MATGRKLCESCGRTLEEDANFCPGCGLPISRQEPGQQRIQQQSATADQTVKNPTRPAGVGSAPVLANNIETQRTKTCERCGNILAPTAKFCNACGTPLPASERKCERCGNILAPTAKFCNACGSSTQDMSPPVSAVPTPPVSAVPVSTQDTSPPVSAVPVSTQDTSPPVSAVPVSTTAPRETVVSAEAEGVKLKALLIKDILIVKKKDGAAVGQIPVRRMNSMRFHEAKRLIAGHITFASEAWGKGNAEILRVFFTPQQQPSFERLKGAIEREYGRAKTAIPETNSKLFPYRKAISEGGDLPTVRLTIEGTAAPVLKKGETVHFADEATAKETKTVSLGYRGGSRGVSVPLPIKIGGSPIRYRIGSTAGHIQREERIVETSRGVLMLTNRRLFLHPAPGHKPISIPLTKILSYQAFSNGIEVYQEGRQKGFFFEIQDRDSVDIFEACLEYLTSG